MALGSICLRKRCCLGLVDMLLFCFVTSFLEKQGWHNFQIWNWFGVCSDSPESDQIEILDILRLRSSFQSSSDILNLFVGFF
jgi:hypothetical protein